MVRLKYLFIRTRVVLERWKVLFMLSWILSRREVIHISDLSNLGELDKTGFPPGLFG